MRSRHKSPLAFRLSASKRVCIVSMHQNIPLLDAAGNICRARDFSKNESFVDSRFLGSDFSTEKPAAATFVFRRKSLRESTFAGAESRSNFLFFYSSVYASRKKAKREPFSWGLAFPEGELFFKNIKHQKSENSFINQSHFSSKENRLCSTLASKRRQKTIHPLRLLMGDVHDACRIKIVYGWRVYFLKIAGTRMRLRNERGLKF